MRHFKLILAIMIFTLARGQELSPSQLNEDFALFKAALTEAHPGLYRYIDKKSLDYSFTEAEKGLNRNMNTLDFYRHINPIVGLLGCGHTKLHLAGRPDDAYAFFDDGLFPLQLLFSEGRVEVIADLSDNGKVPAGAQIVAIKGQPIQAVVEHMKANIFADGYVESTIYEELNRNFPGYYATHFGAAQDFEVAIQGPETYRTELIVLNGVDLKDIMEYRSAREIDEIPVLRFPEPGVALLKIPVFMPSPKLQDFSGFLEKVFREIHQRNVEHLILDLRDNQGGIDAWGKQLYAYLTDTPFEYYKKLVVSTNKAYSFEDSAMLPQNIDGLRGFIKQEGEEYHFTLNENLGLQQPAANPYMGNLYILQNGRSFSVTSEFAAKVRDDKRGVFIGQENGGAIEGNNSGAFVIVNLPNSGLTLGIPLVAYYMKLDGVYPSGRGVLPDHPVKNSVNDIISGNDKALETALSLCRNGLTQNGG